VIVQIKSADQMLESPGQFFLAVVNGDYEGV